METKETIVKNLRQVLPSKAIDIRLHSKKILFDQRILFHHLQREEQENSIVNTQLKHRTEHHHRHQHHYYCSNQKPQNHHVASFTNFICNGMEKWCTYKTIST
uniref:Uncharacterized protein n=1 Tax=Glossina austeni TaxID=7395 RepID=A0A1A9VSN6_GLOAU